MIWVVLLWLAGDTTLALGWTHAAYLTSSPMKLHSISATQTLLILFVTRLLGRAKKAEEHAVAAIGQSEERHRTLVQHAADVVLVSDRDGTTTYVSSTVQRVMGYATGGPDRTEQSGPDPPGRSRR